MDKFLKPRVIVALGVAAVLFLTVVVLYGKFNSTQKTMVQKEVTLSAKYTDNQNVLSQFKLSIREALGVSEASTAAQDKVLTDVIKGRYEAGSTAKPGDGSAFSAIVEAYPNVQGIAESFAKVQSAIFAGREAFKNQQTALLDLLRDYDTWRNSGFIHSKIVSMVGAPSNNLEAAIGDDVVTGDSALRRMKRIVLSADAKESFETGEDNGVPTP